MLSQFFKWYGEELGRKVKLPQSLPPYTEGADVDKLIETSQARRTHKGKATRDRLMIRIMDLGGLRRMEVANLEVKDVQEGYVIVREGKGGRDRVGYLPPSLSAELQDFVKDKKRTDKVFGLKARSTTCAIERWSKKAGVDLHPHSFRHHFGTTLVERGADIRSVQMLMGHSSLNVTQQYLGVNEKRLRARPCFWKTPSPRTMPY